jgi:hypothetical protein
MPVPTSGPFKMFDPSLDVVPINTSLRGAQIHDASDTVTGVNSFSNLISNAQVELFDPTYSGTISSLEDVTGSLQFRNYPTTPSSVEEERRISGSYQATESMDACASSDWVRSYSYIGSLNYPEVGDVVYSGWNPSTYPPVTAGWIKFQNSGLAFETNDEGVVINIVNCNVNILSIVGTSTGFPPTDVVLINNTSTSWQTVYYEWTYDSQEGDIPATVRTPAGDIVLPGPNSFVRGNTHLNSEFGQNTPSFTPPYTFSGNYNATTLYFTLRITHATTDIAPPSPDNIVSNISVRLGY